MSKRSIYSDTSNIFRRIPYEEIPYKAPKLPGRQKPHGYEEPTPQHQVIAKRW